MQRVRFYTIAFTHATHLDKDGFSQLSGPLNPKQADLLNVCQVNEWVCSSVKKEAG